MPFRRRFTETPVSRSGGTASPGQPCGSLGRVLARVYRAEHPEALDLGPLCGDTVVYLARRGARVHVEDFVPPLPPPPRKRGEPPPELPPLRLDQPDERFDLVLAWEKIDFVPPDRVGEFFEEVGRVLRPQGWLFFLSHSHPPEQNDRPGRYRLLADDLFVREVPEGPRRRRWTHSNRDIERAMSGFTVQGLHLQRNQIREYVAMKKDPSSASRGKKRSARKTGGENAPRAR